MNQAAPRSPSGEVGPNLGHSSFRSSRLLDVRRLTKAFPGIIAVDEVDLNIGAGEIVA